MVGHAREPKRSPAAQAASRRNGARSKGPKTAAGKSRSARNAFKHGFRAQRSLPEKLPDWLDALERELIDLSGQKGEGRHEHLDRVLLASLLLREVDDLIDATLSHLLLCLAQQSTSTCAPQELVKLQAYRHRFRVQRDTGIRKLLATGSRAARKVKRRRVRPAALSCGEATIS